MFLERLIDFSKIEMEVPSAGSEWHLFFIALTLLTTFFLSLLVDRGGDHVFRTVILVLWVVMLVGGLYKQTVCNMSIVDGQIVFSYDWEAFPFQLCSTPIYVLPFLAFMRDNSAREFAAGYIITISLIGGVAVYAFPSTVFCKFTALNLHTMVHHGIQIIVAIVTAVRYRGRMGLSMLAKTLSVFTLMYFIAVLLNEHLYAYLVAEGIASEFNMFYINPSLRKEVPIFNEGFSKLSGSEVMSLYYVGVSLGAALITAAFQHLFGRERRYSARW